MKSWPTKKLSKPMKNRVNSRGIETTKSKQGKRDILTEMFEKFGIKVIDVSNQSPKPNNKKGVK